MTDTDPEGALHGTASAMHRRLRQLTTYVDDLCADAVALASSRDWIGQAVDDQLVANKVVDWYASAFNPHGYFVYVLWGADETPIYVGLSTNLFARLGVHMQDPHKREHVIGVSVVRCETEEGMRELERQMIRRHQPEWNRMLRA